MFLFFFTDHNVRFFFFATRNVLLLFCTDRNVLLFVICRCFSLLIESCANCRASTPFTSRCSKPVLTWSCAFDQQFTLSSGIASLSPGCRRLSHVMIIVTSLMMISPFSHMFIRSPSPSCRSLGQRDVTYDDLAPTLRRNIH
jgi:hypothetical protein